MKKPSPESARRLFEKQCLIALAALTKGSGWKKSRDYVVRQDDDLFLAGQLNVYLNADRLVASLSAKPMALDPILWDILDMEENNQMPLSFRAMGAFTCHSLRVAQTDLECSSVSPEQAAAAFMEFIERSFSQELEKFRRQSFTEALKAHPNQMQHGAYAITLVTSLINDGQYKLAAEMARAYASGQSPSGSGMTSRGKSFHELALAWLAARTQ